MKHVHPRAERAFNLILLAGLALMALVTTIAVPAHAEWYKPDVAWRRYNSANVASPSLRPDTLWTTFAASKVDTTADFSIDAADNPPPGLFNRVSTTADSLPIAVLRIFADSSTAATVSFKATTCKLQVNYGDNASGWQDVVTYTSAQTDGQKSWAIPIFASPVTPASITNDLGPDMSTPVTWYGGRIRAIVTGGASVAGNGMRARLVYWSDVQRRVEGER